MDRELKEPLPDVANRGIDDLTPEEELAEEIVGEALRGLDLPADLVLPLRCILVGELLTTDVGLAKLRRIIAHELRSAPPASSGSQGGGRPP